MLAKDFLKQLRHDDIVAAIRSAERRTSGEIRVFITRKTVEDPLAAAQAAFMRLKMDRTREHNGVLIFVAPRSRNFAVAGDSGVHKKCGEGFWNEVAQGMTNHFRDSQFTAGILEGIQKAGDLLARHFPRLGEDRNELSDEIAGD